MPGRGFVKGKNPPVMRLILVPHLIATGRVLSTGLILKYWPGKWIDKSDSLAPHEAELLHLQIDKARHCLGWQPRWDYSTTIERTVHWYKSVHEGSKPHECCLADLFAYQAS